MSWKGPKVGQGMLDFIEDYCIRLPSSKHWLLEWGLKPTLTTWWLQTFKHWFGIFSNIYVYMSLTIMGTLITVIYIIFAFPRPFKSFFMIPCNLEIVIWSCLSASLMNQFPFWKIVNSFWCFLLNFSRWKMLFIYFNIFFNIY